MDTDIHIEKAPGRMRRGVLGVLLATVAAATLATYFVGYRYFERLETDAASSQMVLYLRALNETLRQHQHLPFVLAHDPQYSNALQPRNVDPDVNERLLRLSQEAKLEAIYLMDADGSVLAASNAGQPNSFLGQNYAFRPYFTEALNGRRSDYFAIGATSGRPGYFVAEPVTFAAGTQNGVVAIKLDISELQRSWESDNETVVAVNRDGIIVLASNPAWLYRPMSDLSSATRQAILGSRQFGNEAMLPMDWTTQSETRVTIEGHDYILASGQADWRDWQVLYLRPRALVTRQTVLATVFFGSVIALLLGFATFLRSRRIELAYSASERQRAALVETNGKLEKAQIDLARSAKLAALGHLAASVTHELGQPISAFRNHLAAAEMGGEITSPVTATNLNNLVKRMEAITGQFRYFAQGRVDRKVKVDLSAALREAKDLLKAEIDAGGIDVKVAQDVATIAVLANKVQLEQVFTNLLKNAVHAVENETIPKITVDVVSCDGVAQVRISDNGHGLAGATLKDLQEPFFSTKPSGVGMGLGLAIATEIIKEHGGELTLDPKTEGATFTVKLPLWQIGVSE